MENNLFIAIEGIDGSGKSTQVELLREKLEKAGHKVYGTFEPTDSFIGILIKDILKHKTEADHRVIAGLFVADRLNHLLNKTNGLLKKMEEGYTVITDRYYFSSYAYQGTYMPLDWVIQANSLSAGLLRPHLNIFIDVSPGISIQRINNGRSSMELFETKTSLEKVREKYFEAFEKLKDQETIVIINGNSTVEQIATDIWTEVEKRMELQGTLKSQQ